MPQPKKKESTRPEVQSPPTEAPLAPELTSEAEPEDVPTDAPADDVGLPAEDAEAERASVPTDEPVVTSTAAPFDGEPITAAPAIAPDAPFFAREITPSEYARRTYYAARDACAERKGILRNLRDALNEANKSGRSVVVTISIK
jgi:hypothetical protein